jgi:hypothetical protein
VVCFILKDILKNRSEYESLKIIFFSRIGLVLLNFVKNRNSQFSLQKVTPAQLNFGLWCNVCEIASISVIEYINGYPHSGKGVV